MAEQGQERRQRSVEQRDGLASPGWLNGQTIAIVGTVLTVGVGIGTMVFSSTSSLRGEVDALATKLEDTHKSLSAEIEATSQQLRGEIKATRQELRGEIKATRQELRGEIKATRQELRDEIKATRQELRDEIKATRLELSGGIKGLDARLRSVEQTVAAIQAHLAARHPVTQGASSSNHEQDDVDA